MGFAFPYRRAVGGPFVITVVLAMINAGEPLVLKYVLDDLATRRQVHTLCVGIAALVGLGLAREGGTAISNWLTWKTRSSCSMSSPRCFIWPSPLA
jgi:ATP-binding cassette subfamily B protein